MAQLIPPLPELHDARETRTHALRDGRTLAYMEWGAPEGYPTFYFHGTPSSRLEGALAHAAAKQHGLRLIAIDRPGLGRSTFGEGRRFSGWPRDVGELADALHIDEFGVAGHSGAGPYLFACGALISSERLKFVGALAPWGPVGTPEIQQSLNAVDRFYCRIARSLPRLTWTAFAPLGWCARYWPSLFFRLMRSAVPPDSKRMLDHPGFLAHFERFEAEAFRQGSRGPAHEACIAYRDWDFDLRDVQAPTHVWLGAEDIFVPRAMGEYLERHIPNVDFHWTEGKGHFDIASWFDIFEACARHCPPRAADVAANAPQ